MTTRTGRAFLNVARIFETNRMNSIVRRAIDELAARLGARSPIEATGFVRSLVVLLLSDCWGLPRPKCLSFNGVAALPKGASLSEDAEATSVTCAVAVAALRHRAAGGVPRGSSRS